MIVTLRLKIQCSFEKRFRKSAEHKFYLKRLSVYCIATNLPYIGGIILSQNTPHETVGYGHVPLHYGILNIIKSQRLLQTFLVFEGQPYLL